MVAASACKAHARLFDAPATEDKPVNLQSTSTTVDVQPTLLKCSLKAYQLKGLNWLAQVSTHKESMEFLQMKWGLGKTVPSISLMAYLAEKHSLWGPFLVITPASTLHNWQQEIAKFTPALRVLPYWEGEV